MKLFTGAVLGAVVLGLVVPMACHVQELSKLLTAMSVDQLIVTSILAFASAKGMFAGAIIGAGAACSK